MGCQPDARQAELRGRDRAAANGARYLYWSQGGVGRPEECLTTLKQQLQNYRRGNSELGRSTVFAQAKHTYSGKVTEDGRMSPRRCRTICALLFKCCAGGQPISSSASANS